jgi:hypothetical protein
MDQGAVPDGIEVNQRSQGLASVDVGAEPEGAGQIGLVDVSRVNVLLEAMDAIAVLVITDFGFNEAFAVET